jgi:adenosylcobinamide-GDP ribazoletransferase
MPAPLRAFGLALRFLTVLPFPGAARSPVPADFGRAVALFPLVGLFLAAVLATADAALRLVLPVPVASALLLGVAVALTGALHVDGFLDTCDGLFLWPAGRRLEVMRDSRVGGFAVAGGLVLYGVKLSALISTTGVPRLAALVLAPVLGRLAMTVAIAIFPYARSSGAGTAFKDNTRPTHVALALVVAALVAAPFSIGGVAALALAVAATGFLGRFASARLGGLTGDTYGFICECVEALVLVLAASSLPWELVWLPEQLR